jgi:hypothetical protein
MKPAPNEYSQRVAIDEKSDFIHFSLWCLCWPSNPMMDVNQPRQELGISYPAFHFTCPLIVSLPTSVANNGGVILHEKLPMILPNVAGSQFATSSGGANGTPLLTRAVVSNCRSLNNTLLARTSSTVDPPSYYANQISNRASRRLALTFWLESTTPATGFQLSDGNQRTP